MQKAAKPRKRAHEAVEVVKPSDYVIDPPHKVGKIVKKSEGWNDSANKTPVPDLEKKREWMRRREKKKDVRK